MDRGCLVPDEIVIGMIESKLEKISEAQMALFLTDFRNRKSKR